MKLEDVNVMEGIDFKANRKLSIKNDNVRKAKLKYKKDQEYNNKLVKAAIGLAVVIILLLSFMIFKDDDKNINECVEKGYSRAYCEKSIIGL